MTEFGFSKTYNCFSSENYDSKIETTGRINLPEEDLKSLLISRWEFQDTLIFCIKNNNNGLQIHAGVQNFSMEKDKICIPNWMMEFLGCEENDLVQVTYSKIPKATHVIFQPYSSNFFNLTNYNYLFARELNFFPCVTKRSCIKMLIADTCYKFRIVKTEPEDSVLIDLNDISFEFENPIDSFKHSWNEEDSDSSDDEDIMPDIKIGRTISGKIVRRIEYKKKESTKINYFSGQGHRLSNLDLIRNNDSSSLYIIPKKISIHIPNMELIEKARNMKHPNPFHPGNKLGKLSICFQGEGKHINCNDLPIISKESSINEVLDNIHLHEKHHQGYFNKIYKEEINFLAKNLFQIQPDEIRKLSNLSIFTIESIISNPELQTESESQFLNIIIAIYSGKSKFSYLFEYVDFLKVNGNDINKFLSIFKFEDLNIGIWESIKKRLQREIVVENDDFIRPIKIRKKLFYQNKDFEGIFNYFRNESFGNCNNEISVTASSVKHQHFPINVLKYEQRNYFMSENNEKSWICFDFKDHLVSPTNYTIKSCSLENGHHLKSWKVEGSTDCNNWMAIDAKDNCQFLGGCGQTYTFSIQIENPHDFRFIRICQTGKSWLDQNYLMFDSIEFYGEFI